MTYIPPEDGWAELGYHREIVPMEYWGRQQLVLSFEPTELRAHYDNDDELSLLADRLSDVRLAHLAYVALGDERLMTAFDEVLGELLRQQFAVE